MRNRVLIDNGTIGILYAKPLEVSPDIVHHELYDFAAQFKGERDVDTVAHVFSICKEDCR